MSGISSVVTPVINGVRAANWSRHAPIGRKLIFRSFRGADGLRTTRADWNRVVAAMQAPRFFQLFEWYQAYAGTLAESPSSLRFFIAYEDNVPIGVFPLLARSRTFAGLPARTLELPHDLHLLLGDFVFEKTDANAGLVAALVDHLSHRASESWDVLFLPNLLEDAAAWSSLGAHPPPRMLFEPSKNCDYLDCIPFEERLAVVSKNFRGALRKARNKLAQEPGVEVLRVVNPADIAAAVEEFIDLEGSGWKGTSGTALKSDPRVAGFYRSVAAGFATLGAAEINLLKIGGKCVAGQFCLKVGRCLNILKIGYDEQRSKLAPGNMLLESVMRRCATGRDVDTVNLITDAAWHTDWKPRPSARFEAMVCNSSARGHAIYLGLRAKDGLRPYFRRYLKPLVARWRQRPDEASPPAAQPHSEAISGTSESAPP